MKELIVNVITIGNEKKLDRVKKEIEKQLRSLDKRHRDIRIFFKSSKIRVKPSLLGNKLLRIKS